MSQSHQGALKQQWNVALLFKKPSLRRNPPVVCHRNYEFVSHLDGLEVLAPVTTASLELKSRTAFPGTGMLKRVSCRITDYITEKNR